MTSNLTQPIPTLAAVILAKNEAKHIRDCIATLGFADLVVVSDSFSDDGTAELASAAGADVIQRPFDNFAGQRNAALDTVEAGWIFFVDADERITPELAAEVRQVIGRHDDVADPYGGPVEAYAAAAGLLEKLIDAGLPRILQQIGVEYGQEKD